MSTQSQQCPSSESSESSQATTYATHTGLLASFEHGTHALDTRDTMSGRIIRAINSDDERKYNEGPKVEATGRL